jgi:hypothetical protein
MWKVKTNVMPAITAGAGTFSKSFGKCLNNIPAKHDIKHQGNAESSHSG